eukprot:SAG11_NODE_57_length_19200_cov_18.288417_16_plen_204_part_00
MAMGPVSVRSATQERIVRSSILVLVLIVEGMSNVLRGCVSVRLGGLETIACKTSQACCQISAPSGHLWLTDVLCLLCRRPLRTKFNLIQLPTSCHHSECTYRITDEPTLSSSSAGLYIQDVSWRPNPGYWMTGHGHDKRHVSTMFIAPRILDGFVGYLIGKDLRRIARRRVRRRGWTWNVDISTYSIMSQRWLRWMDIVARRP